MTLKKTDHEKIQLLRSRIDRLADGLSACHLFPRRPQLHFYPVEDRCGACASGLLVHKTVRKSVVTLDVGEFQAVETQKQCKHCQTVYRSEELRALVPHGGKFGFDVIEHVGRALFIDCRTESQIRSELAARNVAISGNEISFLGKRFIVYLMLAHRECHEALKHYMGASGGYILHMDGTCEGDSPHLFSCIDGLSNIVLGNRKMPTEDSQYIAPLLQQLKSDYGTPIGCVHDMGNAILRSVKQVFPGIADFICHFHFLRDLGKDLFAFEYRTIRRYTRSYNVQAKLKKCAKQLKSIIDEAPPLSDSLARYLSNRSIQCGSENLDQRITAYLLVSWVLEYSSAGHGLGFPFDRPHLEFYRRLQEAYPALRQLKQQGVQSIPLGVMQRTLADPALKKLAQRMREKTLLFDALREAMRIACPDKTPGLNDPGDDDIKTIESRVNQFRHSSKIVALAASDTSYHKMVKQIDKYWDKLFADPIEVETPSGKLTIQPQRTNNLMEQSFRFLKRDRRKKSGLHSLAKTLKGMLADTPLVRNLSSPEYVSILLKGKDSLASRFAEIDIQQVRQEEKQNERRWRKYPKRMCRLFKIPDLPQRMMKIAGN
jgi:hypothetical protein